MRRPLVVDLFSGAGGFARGFSDARGFVAFAVDNDEACVRSFKANFPLAHVICDDIREISADDIRYLLGSREVDVVIGSPPCEPFTGANPRREEDPLDRLYRDPAGQLTLEFVRLVGEISPRVFVMENVPAIMEGGLRRTLEREFRYAGYSRIHFNVLRAEDYGTPSRRTRVFISNVRIEPKPIGRRISVAEALRDLPPPGEGYIPNHDPVPLSPRKLRRISSVGRGRALYYYTGAGGRRLPNYIRLNPRTVAPTVLGSSRFIHPFENRLLTVREQARLMGFPDDHVFYGGRDQQFNQVGEAVPPPLARAIASFIFKHVPLV